jgi:hypothetical protein
MNMNTRVLIGLGAAVAANCAPCFDQYYAKALELKITNHGREKPARDCGVRSCRFRSRFVQTLLLLLS